MRRYRCALLLSVGCFGLLTTAALIMSLFLLTSSVVTTLLIPQAEFAEGGRASGRALAFLFVSRIAKSPLPETDRQRLAGVLASRMA